LIDVIQNHNIPAPKPPSIDFTKQLARPIQSSSSLSELSVVYTGVQKHVPSLNIQ